MMNEKQRLIQDFMKLSEGKSSDDMLPLLMAFGQKAKKDNIKFTKEEALNIIENMTKSMPSERSSKLKALANMMF